jgi:tetratricopeptide (TPR) repeat protein
MVADQPPGTLLEAAEAARRMGSPERLAQAISLYLFSDGPTDPRGVELAEDALAGLGDSSPALYARVLASMSLAVSVVAAGQAPARADAALALARQSGDIEALHAALFAQSMLLTDTPRAHELLDVEEELFALGPMPGPVTGPRWRNGVGRGRAIARLMVGDRDGFESGVEELERRNVFIRNPGVAFQAALLRTAVALLDGRFDEVQTLISTAATIPARPEILLDPLAVQLCKLALERGTIDEHKAEVARVGAMRPNSVGLTSMLALVHVETGDPDAATAIVERLAADDFLRVVRSMASTGFAYLAEVAAALDDRRLAGRVYQLYRPYAGLVVASGLVAHCPGSVDRHLGQLCACLGRWDEAAEHYEAAVRIDGGLRSPPLLARTHYWFGRMLLERDRPGDRTRAGDLLEAARGAAGELGMARLAAQASELL